VEICNVVIADESPSLRLNVVDYEKEIKRKEENDIWQEKKSVSYVMLNK
jgi:hypothetical protein